MSAHGYIAYTNGCRCDTCRAAKAEYMRARRQVAGKARVPVDVAGRTYLVSPTAPSHGTRNGYEEYACRCQFCSDAHAASDPRTWQGQAKRASA